MICISLSTLPVRASQLRTEDLEGNGDLGTDRGMGLGRAWSVRVAVLF